MFDRIQTETLSPEELAGCQKLCGEGASRGMHRMAPDICPVLLAAWRNPKMVTRRRREDATALEVERTDDGQ